MSGVSLAMSDQYKIAERMRVELIATAALCLFSAAYLVNKQASRGIGSSELNLQQTQTAPDETGPPYEGHTPSPYFSAVIMHYFDTYLAELHLARQGGGYTRLADHDGNRWVLENGTTSDIAACLAGMPCGLYDTGQTALPSF
jgi:hypothetical protein